jgi:uncharacterized DUF497 family protein
MIDFDKIAGFDWDEGNRHKLAKHEVKLIEAEQVFADEYVLLFKDVPHSGEEKRYNALGRTEDGRHLFVTFTWRGSGTLIRIISARDMNVKERSCYD